jgi:hypothetical protein
VHAIAARILGRIAGDVGGAQQAGDALAVAVIGTTPMLAPMLLAWMLPAEAVVAHRLADLVCDARRLLERAVLDQDAEFIAAEPRDDVRRAHVRLQQRGDVAQQAVAGRVTAGVVDHLELVEVDVQQRVRALARARALQRACSRLSNSRRLIRPVSASWLAWNDSARFRRRSLVTSRNTTTAPTIVGRCGRGSAPPSPGSRSPGRAG